MLKLLVAIPSKNRVETLERYTWGWAKSLKFDVRVFVEPQDEESYLTVIPEANLVKIDANNRGLGYVKKYIQNYAKENGYDVVFKLDDDCKAHTDMRNPMSQERTAEFLNTVLPTLMLAFDRKNLGAIAFPYSFQMFNLDEMFSKVKKMQSSYLVRTDLLCTPYEFSVFEDFSVGLWCMTKGFTILKFNYSGQVQGVPVGGGTGGIQDFDRGALVEKEAELLRKIYPPLVFKKVDKPWKIEPDMRSIKL